MVAPEDSSPGRELACKYELVVRYLLGALSDEEIELLDELSIADDDFARRLQEIEPHLPEHLLACPWCRTRGWAGGS